MGRPALSCEVRTTAKPGCHCERCRAYWRARERERHRLPRIRPAKPVQRKTRLTPVRDLAWVAFLETGGDIRATAQRVNVGYETVRYWANSSGWRVIQPRGQRSPPWRCYCSPGGVVNLEPKCSKCGTVPGWAKDVA